MSDRISKPIYLLIAGAALFVIMFGIKATAVLINPILLALIITIAALPLPAKLTARGVPGKLSLVLTILIVAGAIAGVMFLFAFGLSNVASDIPSYTTSAANRSAGLSSWLKNIQGSSGALLDRQQMDDAAAFLIGFVADFLVQVGMTLLIFVFMISAAIAMPSGEDSDLDAAGQQVDRVNQYTADVRRYLNVTTVINMSVGLLDTIMLLILGVDYALLWGILAWLLGYIPTIGFWLALIPPTLLAWAEFGPTTAAIVFMGFVLINGSVQNFVQPKLMGDNLRISPLIVFLSLFIWGWLLGGVGALLAVPLTLLILTILEQFETTRGLAMLARSPGGAGAGAEDADKQKARQQVGEWWQRGKAFVNPGTESNAN